MCRSSVLVTQHFIFPVLRCGDLAQAGCRPPRAGPAYEASPPDNQILCDMRDRRARTNASRTPRSINYRGTPPEVP